jgi:hypothetical protein
LDQQRQQKWVDRQFSNFKLVKIPANEKMPAGEGLGPIALSVFKFYFASHMYAKMIPFDLP